MALSIMSYLKVDITLNMNVLIFQYVETMLSLSVNIYDFDLTPSFQELFQIFCNFKSLTWEILNCNET